jgi:hypothetical protein
MPPADDYLAEWEYPDDENDDDESETVSCPDCGADVYEDAEQCPQCGHYLVSDTNPLRGLPAAWLWLGLAGVVAAIVALLLC